MVDRSRLTTWQKLLLAAAKLADRGKRPFSAEDLVVTAWRMYPDTFGLAGFANDQGYPAYPDSNRVYAEIMGTKPIRKRGLLVKAGNKMYDITASGQESAADLAGRASGAQPERVTMARETRYELERLIGSRAYSKLAQEMAEEITFNDACAFWRISSRSSAVALEGRMRNLDGVLAAGRLEVRGGGAAVTHGGAAISSDDLDRVAAVHEHLAIVFARELDHIRDRTDER